MRLRTQQIGESRGDQVLTAKPSFAAQCSHRDCFAKIFFLQRLWDNQASYLMRMNLRSSPSSMAKAVWQTRTPHHVLGD